MSALIARVSSLAGKARFVRSVQTATSTSGGHWFNEVPQAAKDPILGVTEAFNSDPVADKINLGVGAYRDDNGKPVVLNVIREAEKRVFTEANFMEYLPIGGLKKFNDLSIKLAYGEEIVSSHPIAALQSLSGTGSLRLWAAFMHRFMPGAEIFIPSITWNNHLNIFRDADVPLRSYRYYDAKTKGLDFEGLMEDLKTAKEGSVVLLHACAHNPTGVDPTLEQWNQISDLCMDKHLFPLFDMAYQGFATGDCDRDAGAVRRFVKAGHQVAVAQSYAKNMGLYGQRAGCLSVIGESAKEASAVESQLKAIARPIYSNPPMFGALLVTHVLSDPVLVKDWHKEVAGMANRIISMRTLLRNNLESLGSPFPWNHITEQIGMFAFSGMTQPQVAKLASEHHIYMTSNGRISMAGVTTKNVERLAQAMHKVTTE